MEGMQAIGYLQLRSTRLHARPGSRWKCEAGKLRRFIVREFLAGKLCFDGSVNIFPKMDLRSSSGLTCMLGKPAREPRLNFITDKRTVFLGAVR
jgi:hypothetical protein